MAKLLVLFAHPALEKSRVHNCLLRHIRHIPGVSIHDLYEVYPEFDIDVNREKQLLLMHDVIIWQHPFYWYSAPAIVKQWQDLVLEHGWAYGGVTRLIGKSIFNVISCGGPLSAYNREGRNIYTISEFLLPFKQTAGLCKMEYIPPFVIPGTHRLANEDIELYGLQYAQLLTAFTANRITVEELKQVSYLNELAPIPEILKN